MKKTKATPTFQPQVGDRLRISNFLYTSSECVVVKITKCTVTIKTQSSKMFGDGNKIYRLTSSGSWQNGDSWLKDDAKSFDFVKEYNDDKIDRMYR